MWERDKRNEDGIGKGNGERKKGEVSSTSPPAWILRKTSATGWSHWFCLSLLLEWGLGVVMHLVLHSSCRGTAGSGGGSRRCGAVWGGVRRSWYRMRQVLERKRLVSIISLLHRGA